MVVLEGEKDNYLYHHCTYREGFVFTPVTGPGNYDGIVIRNPETCECWSPKWNFSRRSLEEHIAYVNQNKIEKAVVIAEDIGFIVRCPSLKHLWIVPADTAPEKFDYSPLYELPEIRSMNCCTGYGGSEEPYSTEIDYSKITGLKEVRINGRGQLNYLESKGLEKLILGDEKKKKDLHGFPKSLKSLWLFECGLKSLEGVGEIEGLQQLVICYCKSIQDISNLKDVAVSLRALSIENCPKILDFSCLNELKSLEFLELEGRNALPDLKFLNELQHLRLFRFSMDVQDCDLTPCLQVPYVYLMQNKKKYNLRDKDLPKQLPIEGFELN